MAGLFDDGDRLDLVRERLFASIVPYESLQVFGQALVPVTVDYLSVADGDLIVSLKRHPAGEYTSGDGARWKILYDVSSPDGFVSRATPEAFGFTGGNIIADTAAMQAWAAGDGAKSLRFGQTYRINGTLDFVGAQDIDASGATIIMDADLPAISGYNAPVVAVLSADYVEGATTLNVTGLSEAPPKGTKIKIHSDARDPANRDNGASASQYRCGEWAVLGEGSTTTTLVLAAPLRHTTGINTVDATRIPAYSVAMQTKVLLIQPAKFRLRGLRIEYTGGEAWTTSVGNIDGYDAPELDGISYGQIYGSAIGMLGNYGARVTTLAADNTETYGIGLAGYGASVSGASFTSCRHGVTTSEATAPVGASEPTTMLRCGRVGAIRVSDSVSFGGDLAGFDTHHGADDAAFVNCIAEGNADFGFQARGRGVVFTSPIVRNSGKGILAFTEFQGDDGAPYLNGKDAADLTDASVFSPQISCRAEPVVCSAAFMRVSGQGRYASPDHRVFRSIGGVLRISGSHYHVVQAGGGNDATGCIQVSAAAAELGGIVGGTIIIEDGADVTIDARAASAALVEGLSAATGTAIIVRGTVTLLMPAGAGNLLGGAGEIRTEGGGMIRYSIEGGDDSTMPLNRSGRDVRLVAIDGTSSLARLRDEPYSSRASMLAAKRSPGQISVSCYAGNLLLDFVPGGVPAIPAGEMADGTLLSPAGEAWPEHFGAKGDDTADDTTAITDYLAYCASRSMAANWPDGVYRVTGNIPELHSVRHFGAATIHYDPAIGTDRYYYIGNDAVAATNILYVAPDSGVAADADGLSTDNPMSFARAWALLFGQGAVSTATRWMISMAAGTYPAPLGASFRAEDFPGFSREVTIVGKKDGSGVPTVIVDGSAPGSASSWIQRLNGAFLHLGFRDITLQNFTGLALYLQHHLELHTENLRGHNNPTTILARDGHVEIRKPIITGAADVAINLQSVYGFVGDEPALLGAWDGSIDGATIGITISRGSICYVRGMTFGGSASVGTCISVEKHGRVRTQKNTFTAWSVAAIEDQDGTCIIDGDTGNPNAINPAALALDKPYIKSHEGGNVFSTKRGGITLVGHTEYLGALVSVPNDTVRNNILTGDLALYRMPGPWLYSDTARGEGDMVLGFPANDGGLLEITGAGSVAGNVLAAITLPVYASGTVWFIEWRFTGSRDGGGAGRYVMRAWSNGNPVVVSRGSTGVLTTTGNTSATEADLVFRCYLTRVLGTGTCFVETFSTRVSM